MLTPGYSDAQRIGEFGRRYFIGNHPDDWHEEGEPKQGGDFGFDVSMWLEQLGKITGRFSIQLKSTVDPHIRGTTKSFISVALKREACNIFIQDGHPVMLVLVALQDGASANSAEMFYTWIHDDIQKRLKGRKHFDDTDPSEITFRIEKENELTRSLDISAYLNEFWSYTSIVNSLRSKGGSEALRAISTLSTEAVSGLGQIKPKSLDRWLVNEALDGDGLWATPRSGSLVSKIKTISEYLTHGRIEDADALLSEIDCQEAYDDDISGELNYQQGRRSMLSGAMQKAYENFRIAAELQPTSVRYISAELETAVLVNIGEPQVAPQELLDRADAFTNNPEIQFQMVRIRMLEGDHAEAERILSQMEGINYRKARILHAAIKKDWERALLIADEEIAIEKDPRHRRFFVVIRLRVLLHIVMGDAVDISIGGRNNLRVEDARRLFDSTLGALRDAKSASWPANSEMLMDCASASCVILDPNDEILDLVADFASKHPQDSHAQDALARIAFLLGKYDLALAAMRRGGDRSSQLTARLVMLLGQTSKYQECVDLAVNELLCLPHEEIVDLATVVATLCANKLGSITEESRLRCYVLGGSLSGRSLLEFLEANLKDPLDRSVHIDKLWAAAMTGEGDETLKNNLFLYLRPDRDEDVDRLISLGRSTQMRRGLTVLESAKYCAALLVRSQYSEAVEFTDRAFAFFPTDENIGLVRALALEQLGQSAAAEAVLRQLAGSTRKDLLHTHSTLLLRVGEVDAALGIVKKALANASCRKDRYHFQRSLAILYSKIDPGQYSETVWRLGEIAERTNEEEEGTFLVHFVLSTVGATSTTDNARVVEFQERCKEFAERFPDSKFFRVGSIPEGGSSGEFLSELKSVLGMDDDAVREFQRLRSLGERSGSLVPLSLRPKGIAPYASNVLDLLLVSIAGLFEGESSKIIVGSPVLRSSDFNAPPVIDLPTLAALVELDLFDHLFSVWTAIAIPKITLQNLSDLFFERSNFGSTALLDKMMTSIRRHRLNILQPVAIISDGSSISNSEHSVISQVIATGEFEFLSIDVSSAVMVVSETGTKNRCHSLWDFLTMAERNGVVGESSVRLVRLRVASWNTVGVPWSADDIAVASRGAVTDVCHEDENSAMARVARRFVTEVKDGDEVRRAGSVISIILASRDVRRADALEWFAKICFREIVLAGSARSVQSSDALTARLLAFTAANVYLHCDANGLMQVAWRVLGNIRVLFGGSEDVSELLENLGVFAADLFEGFIKEHGFPAIDTESSYRELLFSGVTPGTHDRDVIEEAYFRRTKQLQ